MFITCQECNTTFRLDERLLKPTGSKVRCSQCLHTFVAVPPAQPIRPVTKPPVSEARATAQMSASSRAKADDLELDGIDLAELDAMLGDETVSTKIPAGESAVKSGEPDLLNDLDLDLDLEPDLTPQSRLGSDASLETKDLTDDLDLGMDFEIEDEGPPTSKVSTRGAAGDEEELDLLFEEDKPAGSVVPSSQSRSTNDLDLGDLDLDLDDTQLQEDVEREDAELSLADDSDATVQEEIKPAAKSAGASGRREAPVRPAAAGSKIAPPQTDNNLDFEDFDLELDTLSGYNPEEPEEPSSTSGDDLDLSDLDSILNATIEDTEPAGKSSNSRPSAEDAELSLDMGEGEAKVAGFDEGDEALEELDFELDSEFEDKGNSPEVATAEPDAEDDEVDLSDIEEMLGQGPGVPPRRSDPDEDDALAILDDSGEIDLAELESAIDQAEEVESGDDDTELELELELEDPQNQDEASEDLQFAAPADKTQPEEFDLDLELELESASTTSRSKTQGNARSLEDELDLSDLAGLVEGDDHKARVDTISTGDIELEFQIEEDEPFREAASSRTTGRKMQAVPVEDSMDTMVIEERPTGRPKAKPRRSRKGLVMLLLLLLLAAAGGGLYYAMTQMGIQVPYLSEYMDKYLNPAPVDPQGNLYLSAQDINSKFIENVQSGNLFVITGKAHNGYGTPRTNIRVQGKLFGKGKVLVKNEFSYAGMVISDQELSELSSAEIKQRLNQDVGSSVRPGQGMPFMLVFSDLPPADQLDEFDIELVGSAPAGN
jgi:pilus assembly protein FimV